MMPRRIRLFWTVGAVLAVLMVAGVAAAVLVPRLLPLGDEGSLYRRYRNMPGIEATYLKDFPVDDTLTIDVTTLTATDDEGWDTLTADFNIPVLPDIVLSTMAGKEDFILTFKASEDYREMYEQVGICRSDVIALSYIKHIVSIFRTESDSEQKAVLEYNLNQSLKKKQQ